jgi:23S rRNA pseudoU1915 N3-methylase RlmH
MMGELFFVLEQKEKEAEDEFHQYIEYQKTMASLLREGVLEIKNIGQNDNKENIKNFKIEIETILKSQQDKKEEATIKFLELQDIHEKISNSFNGLINQDTHVFCKDLKNVKKYLLEEIK